MSFSPIGYKAYKKAKTNDIEQYRTLSTYIVVNSEDISCYITLHKLSYCNMYCPRGDRIQHKMYFCIGGKKYNHKPRIDVPLTFQL